MILPLAGEDQSWSVPLPVIPTKGATQGYHPQRFWLRLLTIVRITLRDTQPTDQTGQAIPFRSYLS